MEDMLKKQDCGTSTSSFATTATTTSSSSGAALGVHKNSQIIAKVKPKIRIIHIFAPEIIKTDVANFRELVQRLTGKPTEMTKKKSSTITNKRPRNSTSINLPTKNIEHSSSPSSRSSFSTATNNFTHHNFHHPMIHKPFATKLELRSGFLKGEEEIWRNANSGGGFLGGFAELEGFMEQLHHEFPLFPTMPLEAAHHHMDAYGQSQLA